MFKITEEIGLAAGQRRIVAITGFKAVQEFQHDFTVVKKLCQDLKTKPETVMHAIQDLQLKIKDLQKELKASKMMLLKNQIPELLQNLQLVGAIPLTYVLANMQDYSLDDLREFVQLLQKTKPGFYIVLQTDTAKTNFIVSVDKQYADIVVLQDFKAWLQNNYKLQGGGSHLIIQGGGPMVDIVKFKAAVLSWLQGLI